MSIRMAHMFLFLIWFALLTSAMAANSTHEFLLYKNTHFGPCLDSSHSQAPGETLGKEIRPGIFTQRRLLPDEFCHRFWNYSILPTAPTEGAFVFSWANALTNSVTYAIFAYSLHYYNYESPTRFWYWPTFCYGLVEVGLWWISFFKIIAHPHEPHALLSPLAALTTWMFIANTPWVKEDWDMYSSLSIFAEGAFILLVGLQIVGGGPAFVIYLLASRRPQYVLDSSVDVSSFHCDIHTLLFDPTNQLHVVILAFGPIVVAYILLLGLQLYDIFMSHSENGWRMGMFMTALFFAVASLVISLPVLARRDTDPITWNPECGVVHIAMGSGYGFWDAEGADILHKIQSVFTVIY